MLLQKEVINCLPIDNDSKMIMKNILYRIFFPFCEKNLISPNPKFEVSWGVIRNYKNVFPSISNLFKTFY